MTYTIVARCARTGALGVGIATYSLAVGAKVPAAVTGVGAVASQAFVNPTFRGLGTRLLALGHPAHQVLQLLMASDPDIEFRQLAVLDRFGGVACHTGNRTRPWTGACGGAGYVAIGNVLKDEGVAAAMASAFEKSAEQQLAERLMRALEAGRDAGGQVGGAGHLPERSASLLVHEADEHPQVDLRVDSHPDAVHELRRMLDEFMPYVPFYRLRWREPAKATPQEQFVASLGRKA